MDKRNKVRIGCQHKAYLNIGWVYLWTVVKLTFVSLQLGDAFFVWSTSQEIVAT